MTDAELALLARRGDPVSFDALVDRHFPACLRFAIHLLGSPSDAEDAVQETFVRAYRGLGAYRERDTFRAWLFRILVNRCRTAAVRRSRRATHEIQDPAGRMDAPVDGGQSRVDDRLALSRALATLDPLSREAFLLRHGEDMDYGTMARVTGAGISALKMRVMRAREHLRARLEE